MSLRSADYALIEHTLLYFDRIGVGEFGLANRLDVRPVKRRGREIGRAHFGFAYAVGCCPKYGCQEMVRLS